MEDELGLSHKLDPVDFLIVTALSEERDAIIDLLGACRQIRINESLICYITHLAVQGVQNNYTIAVTMLSQMGNVEAGIHTTRAINVLKPRCVLMVGIAAGIKGKVELGDVIVSTEVIYYEQAKRTPDGLQQRPSTISADRSLLHSAQNYREVNWHELIREALWDQRDVRFESHVPQVQFGPFVAGEKVVADKAWAEALSRFHSKLIGIEMESYGVAAATEKAVSRPRFLAIRGVCDFADDEKNDEWHEYASTSAAAFTVGFLRTGPLPPGSDRADPPTRASKPPRHLIAIRHLSMQSIPRYTIVDALAPRYTQSAMSELMIDQTDLYDNGRLTDPLAAVERQISVDRKIDRLLDTHPESSVAYFGIAHIPLLFHLGHRLTNKRRLRFFELNRYTGRWEALQGEWNEPEMNFHGALTRVNKEVGDVVVRISVSDPVRVEEVESIVPSAIASFHLYIEPTLRDVLVSEHQLHAYGSEFRQMLDNIHAFLPNRQRTHVFYAGPVSLAVHFGQLLSHSIDRRVMVYNYSGQDTPRYSWGLEVTGNVSSNNFFFEAPIVD